MLHDITERKLAEQRVSASLQEKEVLLKEIHHRVKNNLQIISSLLSIQIAKTNDPQIAAPLQDSQDRVRSMALIHEHLYQSPTLSKVNMQTYLDNLIGHLADSNQGATDAIVTININSPAILLDIDQSITCGLIVTELFTNAYKHAFPNGQDGKIRVPLASRENEQLCLEVSDNGVGLPADFDLAQIDSLGMKLVTTLTQQLGGDLKLDGTDGTTVRVFF